MKEIWKDIKDTDGLYQVSNLGRVKSLRNSKEKIMKLSPNSKNYLGVNVTKNGKNSPVRVHKLVAMAFLGHVPCGYDEVVDHIDNNRQNNRLDNLQLTTNRHNASKDQKDKTSKYTGVYLCSTTGRWIAKIKIDGKSVWLGRHDTQEQAAKAYNDKLKTII